MNYLNNYNYPSLVLNNALFHSSEHIDQTLHQHWTLQIHKVV